MSEIWEDIKSYEGLYKVSNLGRLKRLIAGKEKILKQCKRNNYMCVTLSKNGQKRTCNIHRLVAETFIPNPENKPEVNHIDGNKRK